MVATLLRLRWLTVVIVVFSALHSVAFIAIGVIRGISGYQLLFQGPPWEGEHSPGIHLARSIDAFLVAMVFLVFSLGVTGLFLAGPESAHLDALPQWMRVKNLSELKFMIWEATLAAMVVACIEGFAISGQAPGWMTLVLPIGLLLLTAGLFLAKRAH